MKKQAIRVLHVIRLMNHGGAEAMIMNLYRQIDREKVQFDFVENTTEEGAFDAEIRSLGGRIYHCPRFTGVNYLAYRKWWDIFFAGHASEYAAVHGHIGSSAAIYLAAAKKYGVFAIAHSHGADGKHGISQKLYKLLAYNTRNIADFFFACSEKAGIDRFGRRVVREEQRYRVFYNAVDTGRFCFDPVVRKEKRAELGLYERNYVIGHVGRFTEAKNHVFLLDIFAELKKKEPDAILLLVGDGDLRRTIEEKARKLQIVDSVILTGVRDDIPELMQAMDLLLFPSLHEGLPVTLVEAQSTGLPCVISSAIPPEAVIAKDLVSVLSLESDPAQWAEQVLALKNTGRTDHHEAIAQAGFDIRDNAKWLEDFYLEKARERNTADGLYSCL